jgi:hypothetical protein
MILLITKSSSVLVAKYKNYVQDAAVTSRIKIVDWVGFEPTILHLRSTRSTNLNYQPPVVGSLATCNFPI